MSDAAPGVTAGMVAPDRVFLFENHDEAYTIWRDLGIRRRILVHIDAHHDMNGTWPRADKSRPRIVIGNYIYPTVEEGFVREVVWVVPDRTLESRSGRRWCAKVAGKISPDDPAAAPDGSGARQRRGTAVLGRPLRLCTLDDLGGIDEPVLLDIDVDYMILPDSNHRDPDCYGDRPWCWPGQLLDRLTRAGLKPDLVTIAYSVVGGYTPLQWKYLGDELAARIGGRAAPALLAATDRLRGASLAVAEGNLAAAEAQYTEARDLWPASAAPPFHLAHLNASLGRINTARAFYGEALDRDPSYRTPFNSPGFGYYGNRRLGAAETAFKRILTLDPLDPNARCGLGLVANRRRRWAEAEVLFREALAADPQSVDAHRGLGRSVAEQGHNAEAIQEYERSLNLTLAGRQSVLDDHILTDSGEGFLSDPLHAQVHIRLGDLYAAAGSTNIAINAYRMGIALGEETPAVRFRLAGLYLRRLEWGKCAGQITLALRGLPAQLGRAVRKRRRRLIRRIGAGRRAVARRCARKPAASLWC
jgi:tetratricopeptide (TPR) repeat protein